MNRRQVLVIAYYFPPMGLSGVQRTLKFVKYLPSFGWEPVVLTTGGGAYYAYDDTLEMDIDEVNTKIYRTSKDITKFAKPKGKQTVQYPSYIGQKLKKIVLQSIFQPDSRRPWKKYAVELGKRIIRENDIKVIYATAPPFTDFMVAKELSDYAGIPFVLDYRDLWVDNAFYFYATPFHKMYSMNLESEILRKSSKAFVITRYMKEKLIQRYRILSHKDIEIIPHGYDPADFNKIENLNINPDVFTITHSGLFPDDLTPKYFLKALANFLKKNPEAKGKIEARFIGLLRKSHIKLIDKLGLKDICYTPGYISHNEAVRNLLESDVLWMMITNHIATPSRLYEYFGAGKPLLIYSPEGNIEQAAMETEAALTAAPDDIKGIGRTISTYFNAWKTGNLPVPNPKVIQKYDRNYLTEVLARELSHASKI